MTPEAQRIAIAEACGFFHMPPVGGDRTWGRATDSANPNAANRFAFTGLPDYLTDLNAMHEAEKVLGGDEATWHGYKFWILDAIEPHRHEIHATAAQRAEAFLRTLGKWEDDK